MIEYIEAHLDTDLTLAKLAAVAGFSPSHFKRLFRRAVGIPARRFVLEGKKNLIEMALETRFAHPSHMDATLGVQNMVPVWVPDHVLRS